MNLTLLALALITQPAKAETVSITVDANQPTASVSRRMFGIFFEEINQAGDGGVYAELVRNRGLEGVENGRLPAGWASRGEASAGSIGVDTSTPMNEARPNSLKIVRTGAAPFAAVNEGFWGIPLRRRAKLRLTLWMRGDVGVNVAVEAGGKPAASANFTAPGAGWKRVEAVLSPGVSDSQGRLVISPATPGTLHVGYASLMPLDTWKGRENGLRKDLATMIEALQPAFVRFPGGCFIEGHVLAQAFDWKKSIGPLERRPGNPRTMWGYSSTYGLGFHEYLRWSEDLGAEPLFVINCGMAHDEIAPMEKMDFYVQQALDALEYANGPVTSKWGALRAQNGRPKPFNLKLIQIGNENGGPAYDERYALMGKAIKAKHPEVELVANEWFGRPTSYPIEILDEHYYNHPTWFWRNSTRYDRYDRKGPQIYVGEYAVTRNAGTGNWAAALSEAAFITGMLRNADVVKMASYAPLLVNVNNRQWNPNAIVYDNHRAYGTPSYWVQWLFGRNRPDRILKHSVSAPEPKVPGVQGRIGLQTWSTAAEFKDISVEVDGKPIFSSNGLTQGGLETLRGNWRLENGVISQSELQTDRRVIFRNSEAPSTGKLVYRLKARKLGGSEGFIIMLGIRPEHELQLNLGGWGNTVHTFQRDGERIGRGVPGAIETNRWYDIRIEHEGNKTRAYLDGKFIEEVSESGVPDFAAVAGVDDRTNEIIVTAVNGSDTPRRASLDLRGAVVGDFAHGWVIRSKSLTDENSFDKPRNVAPRSIRVGASSRMNLSLPPFSVTLLRIPKR